MIYLAILIQVWIRKIVTTELLENILQDETVRLTMTNKLLSMWLTALFSIRNT